ncbi:uncharacterized protein FIBRA_07496 [Fibroporia radiculosa]|uniref:Uncharacterized protein n=1 Tax=Fibroporia radiculosa TaxID=599839 RepID=J4H4N2_9APHY|nr:uncharacterized protein FIBRA_07496 [Fibroporia radiculosa]CCM05284.1 predicted protein [Fibroporia radiculosa]
MLAQCAQRSKLCSTAAVGARAAVDLVRVGGALKVLIECREHLVLAVAQVAFVAIAVPGALRGPHHDRLRGRGVSLWSAEEPGGVCDNVIGVMLHDDAVKLCACDARRAGPRLEVEDERSDGWEASPALPSGADNRAPLVDGGSEMGA